MQAFTVSAAARLYGVDRRTLQRAIQAGRLPLDTQHCLSREALIAAGYLDAAPQSTPQDTPHITPHDTPQGAPQGAPQILGLYDPHAAAVRIRDLRQQGLSYTLIAVQLTREGIPTRYGKPWEHSSVRYVLETYGQKGAP